MNTVILPIDRENLDKAGLAEAGRILQRGGLVAFPTETVYGLGGNALDASASAKIYAAKGRPSDNPLIVHIADREELAPLVADIPDTATKLMDAFWPGPMTLIFRKSGLVPKATTGGLDTVAVRMPSDPVAAELIRAAGVPIAAPSANTSGRPSPTRASHVFEDLFGRIDMIIDGGEVGIGLESTIIDCTGDEPLILRPGYITPEMLEQVLSQHVDIDRSSTEKMKEGERPKAPGMKYRHYAPKAELVIIRGPKQAVVREIKRRAEEAESKGKRVGVIATDETQDSYQGSGREVMSIGSRAQIESVAHNLYAILREFDTKNIDLILSESFDESGLGRAVMNRLRKAAGYHIEDVR